MISARLRWVNRLAAILAASRKRSPSAGKRPLTNALGQMGWLLPLRSKRESISAWMSLSFGESFLDWQSLEQNLTSSQQCSHFLRQVMTRPHRAQNLCECSIAQYGVDRSEMQQESTGNLQEVGAEKCFSICECTAVASLICSLPMNKGCSSVGTLRLP